MTGNHNASRLRYALLAVAILLTFGCSCKRGSGNTYDLMGANSDFSCDAPTVVLDNGGNGTATVYENKTSARIVIDADSSVLTYNYSLNIVNSDSKFWNVTLECSAQENVSRVNATIILHDNSTSSEQIVLIGGNLNQTSFYYALSEDSTIHVGIMNLIENLPEGATILQARLKINTPDTTTYTLYIITFEFT